jgi:hypothetical protein
MKNDNQ